MQLSYLSFVGRFFVRFFRTNLPTTQTSPWSGGWWTPARAPERWSRWCRQHVGSSERLVAIHCLGYHTFGATKNHKNKAEKTLEPEVCLFFYFFWVKHPYLELWASFVYHSPFLGKHQWMWTDSKGFTSRTPSPLELGEVDKSFGSENSNICGEKWRRQGNPRWSIQLHCMFPQKNHRWSLVSLVWSMKLQKLVYLKTKLLLISKNLNEMSRRKPKGNALRRSWSRSREGFPPQPVQDGVMSFWSQLRWRTKAANKTGVLKKCQQKWTHIYNLYININHDIDIMISSLHLYISLETALMVPFGKANLQLVARTSETPWKSCHLVVHQAFRAMKKTPFWMGPWFEKWDIGFSTEIWVEQKGAKHHQKNNGRSKDIFHPHDLDRQKSKRFLWTMNRKKEKKTCELSEVRYFFDIFFDIFGFFEIFWIFFWLFPSPSLVWDLACSKVPGRCEIERLEDALPGRGAGLSWCLKRYQKDQKAWVFDIWDLKRDGFDTCFYGTTSQTWPFHAISISFCNVSKSR